MNPIKTILWTAFVVAYTSMWWAISKWGMIYVGELQISFMFLPMIALNLVLLWVLINYIDDHWND